MQRETKIAVIGLGYVGLPLAIEFAQKYPVVGFDIKQERIDELKNGHDYTLEVDHDLIKKTTMIFTSEIEEIKDANVYIIAVPTPIDQHKNPLLTPLIKSSETVGKVLKKDDIVIYESTVYPGCTEDDCVPVLEKFSGMKFNKDFFCGYSPERMNPGDKERGVSSIVKVTSGSTPEVATFVDHLYASIISAGTFKTSSIKVAEASKIIENSQRDINIAFINELAIIFQKMNIDTHEVLQAASTKWNFLKFYPGLVGGHCIGVDPYYLTFKAKELGYHSEVILSGRRINDNMGIYIAGQIIKLMIKKSHTVDKSKVLVMGLTFKENCPDIRNSRVVDIINELKDFGCEVSAYDPWANPREVKEELNFEMVSGTEIQDFSKYNAVVFAVAHNQFKELILDRKKYKNTVIYDVKGIFNKNDVDGRL